MKIISVNKELVQNSEIDLRNVSQVDVFESIIEMMEFELVAEVGKLMPQWRDRLKERYPNCFGLISVETLWEEE